MLSTVTEPALIETGETSTGVVGEQEAEVGTESVLSNTGIRRHNAMKTLTVGERLARQRLTRRRRIALTTVVLSLAFGGRWLVANQEPTYPVGEGVYATSTSPKWGAMKRPNAATFYMAATDAMDTEAIKQTLAGTKYDISNLQAAPLAAKRPAVALAQPAISILRQGMKYPYVADYQTNFFKSNPIEATGLSRPIPNFIALRDMGRLLTADASVRAAEGNHAGAMESSLDVLRLGVDQSQGHSLMDGMIGILLQGIGSREGMKHVKGLSAPEARAAAGRLQTILTAQRTMAQIMTQERDMIYEVTRKVYDSGDAASAGLLSGKNIGTQIMYSAALLFYTKQGLVNDYASHMDLKIARVKLPYQQAIRLPPISDSSNALVRLAAPNFERAFKQATIKRMWNNVLLTQLAVQAYRGAHGAYPATLGELTQGAKPYLAEVPTDPFSPSGSDLLRYNPKNGSAYSVGENGTDDGNTGDDNVNNIEP